MSEPFVGQISMFGFGFSPRNWALCSGQTLSIQQNAALFALLGTVYGGDGVRSFNLPDLRGRTPLGIGSYPGVGDFTLGQTGGTEGVVLTGNQMPAHTHTLSVAAKVDTTKNTITCTNAILSQTTGTQSQGSFSVPLYATDAAPGATLAPQSIGNTGGQPHPNLMPSLVINFCIALQGVFPSRN